MNMNVTLSHGTNKTRQLGQILLDRGMISDRQIADALAWQKDHGNRKLLGEVLTELGFVTEDQVTEVLAEAYEIPYARVNPRISDPKVIEVLPREFLEKHGILPMFMVNGRLTVAVSEPANVFLIEEIQRLADCPVQLVAATARDIEQTLAAHLPNANVFVIDDIVDGVKAEEFSVIEKQVTDLANLAEVAGQSPIIKLVNYLIFSAVKEGASDVHIEPGDNRLRVRFRIDGRLFEKICPPSAMTPAIVSRIKIMANLDISERRMPQDGGIHVLIEGRPIDLRVSTMPGKFGEKVVVRVIDNGNVVVTLDRLGFNRHMLSTLKHMLTQPDGILLVTGPTGSGKSTTLYSMLAEVNTDDVNICTVEDPVEYSLAGVNQFQVHEKAGFTFAAALRSLLRQDPDIIMLGEVRDLETATISVQAALTGHQVLSTLHTNDAPSAVTRLVNIGVEPFLIAASLRGVLAQRLVRKICTECKTELEPSAVQRRAMEAALGMADKVYHGEGCARCRHTGYKGRVGIFELLAPDEEMRDLIARGATLQELRLLADRNDYVTLRQDGMEKVRAGLTTIDEILYATAA